MFKIIVKDSKIIHNDICISLIWAEANHYSREIDRRNNLTTTQIVNITTITYNPHGQVIGAVILGYSTLVSAS